MDKKVRGTGHNRRHWIQLAYVFLTNGYLKGFVEGRIYTGRLKIACLPGLNCYSCPGALGSCPMGALQTTFGNGHFKMSFYVTGFLMAVGALLGRAVCGFLCPFGLVQDLVHKIPVPGKISRLPGEKMLKGLKYLILVVLVVLLPLFVTNAVGQGKPWFCAYFCPSGTLMAGGPLVLLNEGLRGILGWIYAWKMGILAGIVLLSLFLYRPFCRYLCPLGAIYGFFNPIALYGFRIDEEKCTRCGDCQKACKLNIRTFEKPNAMECIRCGDCRRACPTGAIRLRVVKSRVVTERRE